MSADGTTLIYFSRDDITLDAACALLRSKGLTVTVDGEALLVRWSDGPELVVGINREDWVVAEAAELCSEGSPHASALARYPARFEIFLPDVEKVLDEINTLAEVQMTLHDWTRGYMVNSWNGIVTTPEGETFPSGSG